MKTIKRLIVIVVALLLVSVFSAKGIAAKNKLDNEKVKLVFWTYPRWNGIKGDEPNGKGGDWERYVAANFMKEHPNVQIEVETLVFNNGPQKVNIAIASGNQPDILRDYPGRVQDYVQQGVVVPLDKYITARERAQYVTGVYDLCKGLDGKQYMIPWSVSTKFMVVNRDLFRKAGAEKLLPTNKDRTWTYDQFKEALKAVSNPEKGIYGTALWAGNEQADNGMVALMENFGAQLIKFNKGVPVAAIDSPAGARAANFMRSLIDEKLAMPGAETLKASDCKNLFAQGKIGVWIHGEAWPVASVKALMHDGKVNEFEMYPVMYPIYKNVKPHAFGSIDTFSVFKSGDKIREKWAVEFCKYITSKRYINDLKPSLYFPAYKYADNLYQGDKLQEYTMTTFKFNKDYYTNVKGFVQIRAVFFPALQELFVAREKSAKMVLSNLEQKVQAIIDKNYK